MTTLYDTTVDTSVVNSSHSIVVRLVGPDRKVLDVGCSTGYVARALKANGCTVSGVEYNAEAAEVARPSLEKLVVADLNAVPLDEAFDGETFDAVVMADVLEHLADPVSTLQAAARLLGEDGRVVISVPNVAHGSLRLALLQGRWRYRDTGLLDRTHIHFYTADGLHDLLEAAGLEATEIQSVVLDPLEVEVEIDGDDLPLGVTDWVRSAPEAYAYQYVLTARRATGPSPERLVPVPAVPLPQSPGPRPREVGDEAGRARQAKIDQRNAEIAASVDALRHQVLVARDNAIGLEVTASRARVEADVLRRSLDDARKEIRETHERLRGAIAEAEALRRSRTWRAGRLVTTPLRILRGGQR